LSNRTNSVTDAHRKLSSIVGRIPFATIILSLSMVIFYYSQDVSHLCLFSPCPPEKHLYWTAQLPYPYNQVLGLLLGTFVHFNEYHLYSNLVIFLAFAVPLESWFLIKKRLSRYGVFIVTYSIGVLVGVFLLYVHTVGYGASLMNMALAPFAFYYLYSGSPTLKGIGRFVPVSIGIGIAELVFEIVGDITFHVSILEATTRDHLSAFFLAWLVVVLVSIRKRKMKSRPARQDK